MRKLTLLTLALLCFAAATAQQMPSVTVEMQSGETMDVQKLVDGKTPFIVSFWSTTCKPCIKELDAIAESMEEWSEEADFRVVAVSVDDARSAGRAKAMAQTRGWTDQFILLYDKNQSLKRALNVNLTPQVFVFDKDGKQVYAHTGYVPGGEAELIEKLIELKK